MIDTLPNRELSGSEFAEIKSQNPRFHEVIGGHDGEVSGIFYDTRDGEKTRMILWSPRDEMWVDHGSIPRGLDIDEQKKHLQEFISEHYPDDHVLNEEGKGFDL